MKVIKQLHLVQYFLYEKSTFDFRHVTAFTGGNGVGPVLLRRPLHQRPLAALV